MRVLLEALATLVVLGAGATTLMAALVSRRWRRANRLVADRPTAAPLTWVWSPMRPARLHRRLRRACQMVAVAGDVGPPAGRRRRRRTRDDVRPLAALAAEVTTQAMAVDHQLVLAARSAHPWRSGRISALDAEVHRVESTAVRLGHLHAQWRAHLAASGAPAVPPLDLEERLDAFEWALRELGVGPGSDATPSTEGGPTAPPRPCWPDGPFVGR
ncbi:MAG: hypothetical protein ACYC1D_02720 [Acidimicrobiales bacterium]